MTPETDQPTDNQPTELTSRSRYLSAADIRTVLELHDRECTQVEIAAIVGCSQSTVSNTLRAFNADSKAVARQLRTLTDETIEEWRDAKKVAARRGDHRPAKELLEMAYPELRPQQQGHGAGGGVTVIVAVQGGENPRPAINLSPQIRTVQSEGQ
jgi:predicted transcriptional regulator